MDKLARGVVYFEDEVFPAERKAYAALASGQAPHSLVVTCSDSRIELTRMTQTIPGELFVCRNAGNIIPPFGPHSGGVSATVEYAVSVLGVQNVIVCGHSDCGAMKGLLDPERTASLPAVSAWLQNAERARAVVTATGPHASEAAELRLLTEQNVIAQLDNLRTHASVAAKLATGQLRLHGWMFDIGRGQMSAYDAQANAFLPFRSVYAEHLEEVRQ
ncbi:MAG: carbonic anhydrase [Acidobacteria bacterium]|nr:carbonic anhydrase [Acidobacteriota bacterium]